jgi:D-3-phosphoglycerate dehydrogenase
MARVLITTPRGREYAVKTLQAAGCEVFFDMWNGSRPPGETARLLSDVEAAILGTDVIDAEAIAGASRLRILARPGVGYDAIDVAAATRHGVAVTIGAGTNDRAVADCAIGLMLSAARFLAREDARVRAGIWDRPVGFDVWQKTIGIIGTGRVGKGVAKRATGFEMRILAYDPYPDNEWARALGVSYVSIDELVRESDFVTVHCPLSPETAGIVGERELGQMKPTAFLINTARGGLVDEEALAAVLRAKSIAGAALDVVEVEPPNGPHPFAEFDNVVITPHLAGGTHGSIEAMEHNAVAEVLRALRGEPPNYSVNPDATKLWSSKPPVR